MAGKLKLVSDRNDPVRIEAIDALLTPEQVAKRLNTSLDWVWDHSSRKVPLLPAIRLAVVLAVPVCFDTGLVRSRNSSRSRRDFPQSAIDVPGVE